MPFDVDRPRYVAPPQPPAKRELHPLLHALVKLAILYAVVYAICFTVEGGMRAEVWRRLSDRD